MSDFELVNIWNIYIKRIGEIIAVGSIRTYWTQSELVKVQDNKYELKNNTLKKRIMKRRKSIRRII